MDSINFLLIIGHYGYPAVKIIVVRTIALFAFKVNRRSDVRFVCDVSFSDVTSQSKRGVPLFISSLEKSSPYWKGKVLPLLS